MNVGGEAVRWGDSPASSYSFQARDNGNLVESNLNLKSTYLINTQSNF